MPQRLVLAVWNYKKNKVSLVYSLMMIILDYLHYWNLCCVKATGLTLLNFIPSREAVCYFGIQNFFYELGKHVIKLTFISVCSSIGIHVLVMSLIIEIPHLFGSRRLFFANTQWHVKCDCGWLEKPSAEPMAQKRRWWQLTGNNGGTRAFLTSALPLLQELGSNRCSSFNKLSSRLLKKLWVGEKAS